MNALKPSWTTDASMVTWGPWLVMSIHCTIPAMSEARPGEKRQARRCRRIHPAPEQRRAAEDEKRSTEHDQLGKDRQVSDLRKSYVADAAAPADEQGDRDHRPAHLPARVPVGYAEPVTGSRVDAVESP